MKKYIIITIVLLSLVLMANAQPLPPTSPSGNPVPIAGWGVLALLAGAIYLIKNRNNKKE